MEHCYCRLRWAVGPGSALQGVAEAPEGVNDALADAREDYRSNKLFMAIRSDSARMARPFGKPTMKLLIFATCHNMNISCARGKKLTR